MDANPQRSNQHEVGTTANMRRQFLGEDRHRRFQAVYVWLGQDQDGFTEEGYATHYDTRERQTRRSPEWRLYYPPNSVTKAMREGDILFLGSRERRGFVLYRCGRKARLASDSSLGSSICTRPADFSCRAR